MDPVILGQSGDFYSLFHWHCGIQDPFQPLDGSAEPWLTARSAPLQQKQPSRRTKSQLSTSSTAAAAAGEEQPVLAVVKRSQPVRFDTPGGLPPELWEMIFSYLPVQSLAAMAQTCRFFTRLRWPVVIVDRLGYRLDEDALRAVVSHQPEELRLVNCPRLGEHGPAILISCPTIRKLRLQGVALSHAGVEHVARGFFSHYNRVRECVLRNCKINDEGIAAIAAALQDTPTGSTAALTTLSLANNVFTGAGLAQLLGALGPAITTLNLSGNPLGGTGGAALGQFLLRNTTLRVLTLENTDIGLEGMELVSTALRTNSGLRELHLAENALDARSMLGLARALEDNTTLEVVDVHANVIESEGTTSLARSLRTNRTVKALNLWDNRIGQNGARALAQMLETNTTLEMINLRFNSFTHVGVAALAAALRTNRSLLSLDLGHCFVSDTGAAALAQTLETNNTLADLSLCDADIGNAGAARLGLSLTTNRSLRRLALSHNRITDAGATGLAQGLVSNVGLLQLLLQGSDKGLIGPDGARQLALSLRQSTVTLLDLERNNLRAEHTAGLLAGVPSVCSIIVMRQPCKQQVTWPKKKRSWLSKFLYI